ncbi:MAG: hypothetical protein WC222_06565 [Parachlamydiales bacterium]
MVQRPLKKVRRPFLLLEVLIAFLLVALCAIPLVAPHVSIYKDQLEFMDKIQLDHFVNQYYAELIEKLYRQNIAWDALTNETKFKIDKEKIISWDNRQLPYEGSYSFSDKKHKPKEPKPFTVYLLQLTLTFKPVKKAGTDKKSKDLVYKYDIFVPRQLPGETPEKKEDGGDKDK